MKKSILFLTMSLFAVTQLMAAKIEPSTTLPGNGTPEHVYTMKNGNSVYSNALTAPTQTASNYGTFAFYAVDGVADAYYIYSAIADKWLSYTTAASYSNQMNFVTMVDAKPTDAYFKLNNYSDDYYEIRPYTTSSGNDKYLNWYGGINSTYYSVENGTLGLWQQGGSADGGSRWTFEEVMPAETNIYIIENVGREGYIIHDEATGNARRVQSGYAQSKCWEVATTNGKDYTFKNLLTGKYITHTGSINGEYTVSDTKSTFTITSVNGSSDIYYIGDGNSTTQGLHASNFGDLNIIRYNFSDGTASQWRLVEATAEDLAAVEEYKNALNAVSDKENALKQYFADDLYTILKNDVTSADGIADNDVRQLVQSLLSDAAGYKKFRVGEYEPYMTVGTLQGILKTSNPYNQYENPTGIYLTAGQACYVVVSGIGTDPVKLTIKNWVTNGDKSTYTLHNGFNYIVANTEGNVFVSYYTDNYKDAPNVRMHFINAPVLGYWDSEKHNNTDWANMLNGYSTDEQKIIITRSKHAQLAFPIGKWLECNSTDIESTMEFYEQVQTGTREMMGFKYLGMEVKNSQLFYAKASGPPSGDYEGASCAVSGLGGLMSSDVNSFDFWTAGHEWGHNNQITPGFKWSGCGETTNNIYASWVQFKGTPNTLRLEDEKTGVNDYSDMRGGRMQVYFEEGLRKGVQWQLQNGPDYHGNNPEEVEVYGEDADGNKTANTITTTKRNYDHFVKLSPFWQLNLWGTLANKRPDIIPQVIHAIRSAKNYGTTYNTNGKQQINWMKLACEKAELNLLPFFEKAGMLKPINNYIEDYGAGWNIIDETMIENLKTYIESKNYPEITEEINYINGHNYHIYRDELKLEVPATPGEGCSYRDNKVTVQHSSVKNAIAFETYNAQDELVRITMYALGSDAEHTYTQVLFPSSEGATYIMAVGYDGTRKLIYGYQNPQPNKYYRIISNLRTDQGITAADNSAPKDGIFPSDGAGTVKTLKTATVDKKDISNLWQFDPVETGSSYYIRNANTKLAFANTTQNQIDCSISDVNAGSFEFVTASERTGCTTSHWWLKRSGLEAYLNAWEGAGATKVGVYGTKDDNGNIWEIEEATDVEVQITAAGWATLCLPFEVNVPSGVTAYIAGESNGNYLPLTALEGVIPANEPVLLEGEAKTYTFTINTIATATKSETNTLSGTTVKRTGFSTTTPEYMALGNKDGVGMYQSVSASIPANKAFYVFTDNEVNALHFSFGDETTGVENVAGMAEQEAFYDLNGRRVAKPTRGIYVTGNGKKVFFTK